MKYIILFYLMVYEKRYKDKWQEDRNMENNTKVYVENLKGATLKLKTLVVVILFLTILALSSTEVYFSSLTPFGISIVFALFYIGFNGYLLSAIFLVAYNLSKLTIPAIFISLVVSGVLVLSEFIRKVIKGKKRTFSTVYVVILYLLSLTGFIIMGVGGIRENLALIIAITLSIIFLFVCLHFLKSVTRRGIWIGLNLDEKICGSIIYLVFLIGTLAISISYFNLGLTLFPIVILISMYVSSKSSGMVITALTGVALAIYYLDPLYISLVIVLFLGGISFKGGIKVFSAIAVEFSYIIFILLFGMGFDITSVLSVTIGVLVFIFVPRSILDRLSQIFSIGKDSIQKDTTIRIKKQIEERLKKLSNIFNEMNITYRSMVRGVLDDKGAMELIKTELVRGVCDKCTEKNNCYRLGNSFLDNSLDMIVSNGYERGKVLLVDLPQYLTSNCSKVNSLVGELNNMLVSYKEYTSAISNLDNSRILIAEQLCATSRLLDSVSDELSSSVTFDKRLEEKIIDELRYRDIMCIDAEVYQKDISVKEITLIVTSDTVNDKKIEKYVSKVIGVNMQVVTTEDGGAVGTRVITMISRPNYDIAFGSSVTKKSGSKDCGDNFIISPIDSGRYLISLSDGMGSGARAKNISRLTIELVENFYKAGFESDLILSTVNQLLTLSEEENFATIDLCIVDGRKNTYDFIKLAGCNGYIIRDKGEVEVIEGSNLPVGILEDIKPHISKRLISNMDMLVFISDGVEDILSANLNISDYLQSLDIINPQSLSDEIMSKAITLSDGIAKDDMTVIAVRVFGTK